MVSFHWTPIMSGFTLKVPVFEKIHAAYLSRQPYIVRRETKMELLESFRNKRLFIKVKSKIKIATQLPDFLIFSFHVLVIWFGFPSPFQLRWCRQCKEIKTMRKFHLQNRSENRKVRGQPNF